MFAIVKSQINYLKGKLELSALNGASENADEIVCIEHIECK